MFCSNAVVDTQPSLEELQGLLAQFASNYFTVTVSYLLEIFFSFGNP
jgi:hypothetical protein